MKKISIITLFILFVSLLGCSPTYDEKTIAAVQPCLATGRAIDECVNGYRQYASSQNNDTSNWMSSFVAGAAGAAIVNQMFNGQQQRAPVYQQAPVQYATPVVQRPVASTAPVTAAPVVISKPTPAVNTKTLIANQEVQPLFAPTKIVKQSTSILKSSTPTAKLSSSSFAPKTFSSKKK